ncbi:MAG: metallophosphoesterase [Candidatus Thorarchaeota archaeon]|nr:metallophosphoesterase [Candidatus Thorarchaeota archaeon]
MNRRDVTLALVVIVLTTTVGIMVAVPRIRLSHPEVSVTGGHLLAIYPCSATIRALGAHVSVTLEWADTNGLGVFDLRITNVDTRRVQYESLAQLTVLRTEANSETIRISTPLSKASVSILMSSSSKETLNMFVFGDSQGYQGGLEEIVRSANIYSPDFIFHCGDLTPFGQPNQYEAALSVLNQSRVPFFSTIGNHDVRLGGGLTYRHVLGPATYSFDFGHVHFSVFNSSGPDVEESEIEWLEADLENASDATWRIVFTHTPVFDPRTNGEHALPEETARRLMRLFESHGVDAVFSGHIHLFSSVAVNGVLYVVTGGAGAGLYASEQEGGFYHYVNVTIAPSGMTVEPILLDEPAMDRETLVIRSSDDCVVLTVADLSSMQSVEGQSAFQNQYGVWGGAGVYRGVRVSDLVALVGGMALNGHLMIIAHDGFAQAYCYSNVYPDSSWLLIQGEMILAYAYNHTAVPLWSEGPRVVMIPPDGEYSNDDCMLTSAPGTGWFEYPSAGSRWVRYVNAIEVLSD